MDDADRAADLAHAEWTAERRELAALRERDETRAIARELAEATTLARDAMWADDPAAGWREIIALLDFALTRAREAGIIGE